MATTIFCTHFVFAGTTKQVDSVICNKHKRAKQQTLQSLQCYAAQILFHSRGFFQGSMLKLLWAQGLSECQRWNRKYSFILQKRQMRFFAAILRSSLVTSSDLYFITRCVKRWSCMIFLWLLHVKYYNIVASENLWNGSVVTWSPGCQVFVLEFDFYPHCIFLFSKLSRHVQPYNINQPSSFYCRLASCVKLLIFFLHVSSTFVELALFVFKRNSSSLIGGLWISQTSQ